MEHTGKSLVIDSNGLFAKSFYAAMSSPSLKYLDEGYLVAALKSFFSILRAEIGTPEKILFCFDGKSKTNKPRPPKPKGYHDALDQFKTFIQDAFGSDAYALHADHEADDLVATVVTRIAAQGGRSIIMSGDKDLQQLRTHLIEYYCFNRKHLLDTRAICEKWGIHRPIHIALALALIGDNGDGINGVDKIGAGWVTKKFAKIDPNAALCDVMDQIVADLKPEQQEQFYSSLDFTLLNTDVQTDAVPVLFNPNKDPKSLADGPAFDEWNRGVMMLDPAAVQKSLDNWEP